MEEMQKKTTTKKVSNIDKKDTVKKSVEPKKKVGEKKTAKAVKEVQTQRTTNTAKKNTEKKPAKATTESKQEKNIEENKKIETKNNKYIYISVGTIACILIILGLILLNVKLGLHAYDIIKGDKAANSEVKEEQIQENENSNTTQEIGNVLKNSNETVKRIIEKITFSPSVTASIYAERKFDMNTISNVLKLKTGWEKTKNEKKVETVNENNEEIITLEKTTMDETIKEIFGSSAKCNSESFDYTNTERIDYSQGMYTRVIKAEIEETSPLIYQEVQKVVKYSDRIVVYVKTIYINIEDGKYVAYKNFEEGNFADKLVELTSEELFGDVVFNNKTGDGLISLESNQSLDSIRNKLNTYKYTFGIDTITQEYYLNEFCKDENGL